MDAILFLIFAAIAVACALNLVLQRHPIASALSLIGVMAAIAVLFLLLGGEFIAMAQLIVYAGAVMVLFVFVIMLLNAGTERKIKRSLWGKFAGLPLLAGLIGAMTYVVHSAYTGGETVRFGAYTEGTAQAIGSNLFRHYVLPFEIT